MLHSCIKSLVDKQSTDIPEALQAHERAVAQAVSEKITSINSQIDSIQHSIDSSIWSIDTTLSPVDCLQKCQAFYNELQEVVQKDSDTPADAITFNEIQQKKKLLHSVKQSLGVLERSWGSHHSAIGEFSKMVESTKTINQQFREVMMKEVGHFQEERDFHRRSEIAQITRWKAEEEGQWIDRHERFTHKLHGWVSQCKKYQLAVIATLLADPVLRSEVSIFRSIRKNFDQLVASTGHHPVYTMSSLVSVELAKIVQDWNDHLKPNLPRIHEFRSKLKLLVDQLREEIKMIEEKENRLEIMIAKIDTQESNYYHSLTNASSVTSEVSTGHELIKQGMKQLESKKINMIRQKKIAKRKLALNEALLNNTRVSPPADVLLPELMKEERQLSINRDIIDSLAKNKEERLTTTDKKRTAAFLTDFTKRLSESHDGIVKERGRVMAQILKNADTETLNSREVIKMFTNLEFQAQIAKQKYLEDAQYFKKCSNALQATYFHSIHRLISSMTRIDI